MNVPVKDQQSVNLDHLEGHLDKLSVTLSERLRIVAVATIAVCWGFILIDEPKAKELPFRLTISELRFPLAFALLALALDVIHYLSAYFHALLERSRILKDASRTISITWKSPFLLIRHTAFYGKLLSSTLGIALLLYAIAVHVL